MMAVQYFIAVLILIISYGVMNEDRDLPGDGRHKTGQLKF
jgi:hypothetical protein